MKNVNEKKKLASEFYGEVLLDQICAVQIMSYDNWKIKTKV